jgi:8-oxo-dGTP pyrophosphatase MutT (NUDIX family)
MSDATSAVMVVRCDGRFLTVSEGSGRCCPGGKREPADRSTKETAIRETLEESGVFVRECVFIFQKLVGEHLCDCYLATDWLDVSSVLVLDNWDGSQNLWHLALWLTPEDLVSDVPGEIRFPDWNAEMLTLLPPEVR